MWYSPRSPHTFLFLFKSQADFLQRSFLKSGPVLCIGRTGRASDGFHGEQEDSGCMAAISEGVSLVPWHRLHHSLDRCLLSCVARPTTGCWCAGPRARKGQDRETCATSLHLTNTQSWVRTRTGHTLQPHSTKEGLHDPSCLPRGLLVSLRRYMAFQVASYIRPGLVSKLRPKRNAFMQL